MQSYKKSGTDFAIVVLREMLKVIEGTIQNWKCRLHTLIWFHWGMSHFFLYFNDERTAIFGLTIPLILDVSDFFRLYLWTNAFAWEHSVTSSPRGRRKQNVLLAEFTLEKCKPYVRSGKINKKKKKKIHHTHQATLFLHFLLRSDNSELSQAPSCGSEAAVLFSCLYWYLICNKLNFSCKWTLIIYIWTSIQ